MSVIPATTSNINAAINTSNDRANGSSSITGENNTLADNFAAFLTLLTTQLQNQNPLEPLDTNQFTQQLVQFAQVEQQLKSNDQLNTLIGLQKSAQQTSALNFVGYTVAVDGSTAHLDSEGALWRMHSPKPANATVNITNATGQTVYSGNFAVSAGVQEFFWDGKGNNGVQWPEGEYTISIVASDAAGQRVSIPTEIQAPVDSVDLTQDPPRFSIAGMDYTMDKIRRIVR